MTIPIFVAKPCPKRQDQLSAPKLHPPYYYTEDAVRPYYDTFGPLKQCRKCQTSCYQLDAQQGGAGAMSNAP